MFKYRQIISFIFLSLYLVVFLHNSIPHTHHDGQHQFDQSISLSENGAEKSNNESNKEQNDENGFNEILKNLVNGFSHDAIGDDHLVHLSVSKRNVTDDKKTVHLIDSVHQISTVSTFECDSKVYRDSNQSPPYCPVNTVYGLRAPPIS